MGIHFHYSHPTTPAGEGFDYDIGDAVEWGSLTGLTSYARLGESAISSILVEDVSAGSNYKGLHRLYVVEDEMAANNKVIWNGYVGEQTISRGEGDERTPFGRMWELQLHDDNAILGFRVIWDSDGNRPAETAEARLTWLMGSSYLSTVEDTGYIDWTGLGVTDMDANDYRGQTARDVLTDIALQTQYNFFAFYDEAAEPNVIALWMDSSSSASYVSLCKISNDLGSAASNVFFPSSPDTRLIRDPNRIAAGVYLPYDGGSIYAYDYATSYEFGFRDQIAPTATVKTAAKASNLASTFLQTFDEQDERVETVIWMPRSQVNDIKAGHLIDIQFSHLPGYAEFRPARVLERTVRNFLTAEDVYEVALTLTPGASLYTGDVFSGYLRSENYPPGYWDMSTENPTAGWWDIPTRGPIVQDQTSAPFSSFTVSANMYCRLHARMEWSGVVSDGYTLTLTIRVNGEAVGTETWVAGGGGGYKVAEIDLDIRDFLLVEGDVISAEGTPGGGWTNFGTNYTWFFVGRGNISGTNFSWSGP